MHDIEFPFLGPMHFEARLGQSLFCRPFLSLFITSIKNFLHAYEISKDDDFDKIKLEMY